ncbi:MAG TPA: hypothetical protein VNE40_01840 [Candidatus Dormibacteraeota bacterium]|nr:hypothetical protein [Candidatus Dormibacteraeota bacterium]
MRLIILASSLSFDEALGWLNEVNNAKKAKKVITISKERRLFGVLRLPS